MPALSHLLGFALVALGMVLTPGPEHDLSDLALDPAGP